MRGVGLERDGELPSPSTVDPPTGDRAEQVRLVDVLTLVIHGADDAMCDFSRGRATAASIPRVELVIIEGMGHDVPRALWPEITSRIATLVQRVESQR